MAYYLQLGKIYLVVSLSRRLDVPVVLILYVGGMSGKPADPACLSPVYDLVVYEESPPVSFPSDRNGDRVLTVPLRRPVRLLPSLPCSRFVQGTFPASYLLIMDCLFSIHEPEVGERNSHGVVGVGFLQPERLPSLSTMTFVLSTSSSW